MLGVQHLPLDLDTRATVTRRQTSDEGGLVHVLGRSISRFEHLLDPKRHAEPGSPRDGVLDDGIGER
ncbi:MAG: hypothetical protein R2705_16800 [Ilumatobacteraceae bacterium]